MSVVCVSRYSFLEEGVPCLCSFPFTRFHQKIPCQSSLRGQNVCLVMLDCQLSLIVLLSKEEDPSSHVNIVVSCLEGLNSPGSVRPHRYQRFNMLWRYALSL